ncbi:MAG: 30S ribosomal protein S13 [bacterium]
MARIAGVDIPRDKPIEIALTYIYGIGRSRSKELIKATGIDPTTRVRDMTEEMVSRIRRELESKYRVEGDVRREVQDNIKRLIEIGCYRGIRHRTGMPVRGQRTHTNARTKKGRRPPVGMKKKSTGKKG